MEKTKVNYPVQILGRIVNSPDFYYQNMHLLNGQMFAKYQKVYENVVKLIKDGKNIGFDLLMDVMPENHDEILDIMTLVDFTIPHKYALQQLIEKHRLRIINDSIFKSGMAKTSDEKAKILSECISELEDNKQRRVIFQLPEVMGDVIEHMQNKTNVGNITGFKVFDDLTGGLQPSDLIVIAASSSVGKTSLALDISRKLMDESIPQIFISMELSKTQIGIRLFCASAKASISSVSKPSFTKTIEKFRKDVENKNCYLADIANTEIQYIEGVIRNSVVNHGVKVVFVDYLQLIRNSEIKNREQEIGHIARRLKNIAKELNIPIVAISQLSRSKDNEKPTLNRLRDSGQIEEAADVVWMIWRPDNAGVETFEYYDAYKQENVSESTNDRAMHIIAKGRNYGTAEFTTAFEKRYTSFIDDNYTTGATSNHEPSEGSRNQLPF
jgi:replicative DNA helicase